MSNYRLINETAITSTVTQVDVTDVFSSDFDIYHIVCYLKESASGQQQYARIRFINSHGNVISAGYYDYAQHKVLAGATEVENRSTSADNLLYFGNPYTDDSGGVADIYVFNPSQSSLYTHVNGLTTYTSSASLQSAVGIGLFHHFENIAGFRFYQSSGSLGTDSMIRTYALRVDG